MAKLVKIIVRIDLKKYIKVAFDESMGFNIGAKGSQGELIVYPSSRCPSLCLSHIQTLIFSQSKG